MLLLLMSLLIILHLNRFARLISKHVKNKEQDKAFSRLRSKYSHFLALKQASLIMEIAAI